MMARHEPNLAILSSAFRPNAAHTSPRSGRPCSRVTGNAGTGHGFHPAMARACARAFALSVMPGNSRRTSIAADSSPA
jgi:hypothetical protein